jgi:putative transcriptional regulator
MRKDLFDQLIESVKEMKAVQSGRRKPSRVTRADDVLKAGMPDVAALRSHLKLSQAKFAALLGISTSTLQNWEQHRRKPKGPPRCCCEWLPRTPRYCYRLHEACRSAERVAQLRRLCPRYTRPELTMQAAASMNETLYARRNYSDRAGVM